MAVGNPSGVKQYNLVTPNRRHISKAAARGHKKGVVDQCFEDTKIRDYIFSKVSRIIQSELKAMCSERVSSILRNEDNEAIKTFKWDSFLSEVQLNAPILYQLLLACTKTKEPRFNRPGVIGMCMAMLLRHRSDRMSLVHKIIALILYTGHSGKQVNNPVAIKGWHATA